MTQYQGSCFCGAVKFQVSGTPEAMGYCHCDSCRRWSAGPVNAFSLWPYDSFEVLAGADQVDEFHLTEQSYRKWCKKCGGHVFTDHPALSLMDVYVANLPGLTFEPAVHVHYQESVLPIRDGLPKMKDVPAEMGGSGDTLPE